MPQSCNVAFSNAMSDSTSRENVQTSSIPKSQSQVRTRSSKNNLSSTATNVDNLTGNRKSSLQRPQSIDIEDEFNDKIRYARLATLQNNVDGDNQKVIDSKASKHHPLQNASKNNVKNRMAPLFSPSRKILLDSNVKQTTAPSSQSPSPSKIPIANDYFDNSICKSPKRSNISPPRKLTPPSHGAITTGHILTENEVLKNTEMPNPITSRHDNNEDLLLRKDTFHLPTPANKIIAKDSRFGTVSSGDDEFLTISTTCIDNGGSVNPGAKNITRDMNKQNGTTTEQNMLDKIVPLTLESYNSRIPLPKIQNNRSRSASQSPSKYSVKSSSSSPATSQSPTRGRSENKTRLQEQTLSESSKGSSTTSGLPTIGWSLQTEQQELRSENRSRNQLSEYSPKQGIVKIEKIFQ